MPLSLSRVDVSVNLKKGDYAIQVIQIPKNSSVTLCSKGRVRLLFVGKRNRPMFMVEQNSVLILREKLEIYYNTNNVKDVMRLMIKKASENARADVSNGVMLSLFSQKVP